MITFIEHPDPKYIGRTIQNVAASDITFAFAFNFNTPGEKLTKYTCKQYQKIYVPVSLRDLSNIPERAASIRSKIRLEDKEWIVINIAGNGLHSLAKHNFNQQKVDLFVYAMLKAVLLDTYDIIGARNGGQTGADEAGGKATARLGIKTMICAPKGWMFRDIDGKDIRDEYLFKKRFEDLQPAQRNQVPPVWLL
jgi:hypothetical protein